MNTRALKNREQNSFQSIFDATSIVLFAVYFENVYTYPYNVELRIDLSITCTICYSFNFKSNNMIYIFFEILFISVVLLLRCAFSLLFRIKAQKKTESLNIVSLKS